MPPLANPIDSISLHKSRAKKPRENGILRMASLLTTIYAEVVKTAAIRKFSHASMRASSSPDSPYSPLLLSRSCSPGVLRKRPISERAWGRFARMRFANGDIDHLDADCGQNRRHSQSRTPTPMLAKLIPALASVSSTPSRWQSLRLYGSKTTPSHQQARPFAPAKTTLSCRQKVEALRLHADQR